MFPFSLVTTHTMEERIDGVQLVAHIGDISYAMGYASAWEYFHDQIQPISSSIPWMTLIGNHERDWPDSGSARGEYDSGGECGIPYEKRFIMPTSALDKPWYSFDFGPIHFIFISTEHKFAPLTEQYDFVYQVSIVLYCIVFYCIMIDIFTAAPGFEQRQSHYHTMGHLRRLV